MKPSEKPMKNRQPIVPRVGNFYVVRSGSVEKLSSVRTQKKPTGGQRISAEEAAQRIVQQFGRSLAVLAD
jgi:hypothetical protein